MNKKLLIGTLSLLTVPFALAGGMHVQPNTTKKHWVNQHHVTHEKVHRREIVRAGDLKSIITRLAANYGWQKKDFFWQPEKNYQWRGTTVFKNKTLAQILSVILEGYPLQAQFYDGNHVLVITTRNLESRT